MVMPFWTGGSLKKRKKNCLLNVSSVDAAIVILFNIFYVLGIFISKLISLIQFTNKIFFDKLVADCYKYSLVILLGERLNM